MEEERANEDAKKILINILGKRQPDSSQNNVVIHDEMPSIDDESSEYKEPSIASKSCNGEHSKSINNAFKDEEGNTFTSNMDATQSKGSTVSFQTFNLEPPMEYEEIIQKLEGDIRKHIRVQNQLKLHIESLQGRVDDKEKESVVKNQQIIDLTEHMEALRGSIAEMNQKKKQEIKQLKDQSDREIKRITEENKKLNKVIRDQSQYEERKVFVAKSIPHSSIERAKRPDSIRSNNSHGPMKVQEISGINIKKHHRHGSNTSNLSSKHYTKLGQSKKQSNFEIGNNPKQSFNTNKPVKQSPYSTMRYTKTAEGDNMDLDLLQDWDKQKTMPVQARQTSSKKRKSDCKKIQRKSENKSKNKSLLATSNSKSLRYDLYKGLSQYNQSMGTFGKPVNTSSQTQLKRSQLYSTANVHNKSTSNLGSGSMNMKAHLSKKMIKNYVNTNREKDHMGIRYEIEKNGNQKRLNTYAKKAAQRENNGAKRPKSTLDNAPTFQGGSNIRKVPKTYQSPSGIADESRKTKVKVYKLEKNKIVSEIEDRRKHLKSKSQSNFSSQHAVDHKAKKLRNSKIKKTDIYSQNFMSNELQKSSGIRENASKITSPGSENKKSPMRTVSNFQQMNKVIKKVNNTMKNSRSHYTRKAGTERELNKNHSLIAESGCSGFFGNNKNKGNYYITSNYRTKERTFRLSGYNKTFWE
ncbi:unnamed protein product [Moneuplotes crassus]|uniref:Uncharacterized protein n=1 Tax=Euplotes crassus TaxID=5936 RepID=A0AAD1Y8Q3_EUPCR|nr:unnamed protein product [Moneuplotes crassus]